MPPGPCALTPVLLVAGVAVLALCARLRLRRTADPLSACSPARVERAVPPGPCALPPRVDMLIQYTGHSVRMTRSPVAVASAAPGWAGGFGSLVQVATGIAQYEGTAERPGALPARALDRGTGYVPAAAVPRALTEQTAEGGTRLVRSAPARTAAWLRSGVARTADPADTVCTAAPWLAETGSGLGRLRYARPPVSFVGWPADWSRPPRPWGTDPARWA